jgi:hypothetical protein
MDEVAEILIANPTQIYKANECSRDWSSRIKAMAESVNLSSVPDVKFAHSIAMFSVFLFYMSLKTSVRLTARSRPAESGCFLHVSDLGGALLSLKRRALFVCLCIYFSV